MNISFSKFSSSSCLLTLFLLSFLLSSSSFMLNSLQSIIRNKPSRVLLSSHSRAFFSPFSLSSTSSSYSTLVTTHNDTDSSPHSKLFLSSKYPYRKFSSEPLSSSLSPLTLPSETLYIVDGTSLLFRSFYGTHQQGIYYSKKFTPDYFSSVLSRLNLQKDEEETFFPSISGIFQALLSLSKLISITKPKYLLVVFDSFEKTHRSDMFEGYKAQRKKSPLELRLQLRVFPLILELLGIKSISYPKHEADDLMASVDTWAKNKGLSTVHFSLDKDMLQLLEPNTFIMDPRTYSVIDPHYLKTNIGIDPRFILDYFALMGDSADNIPGASGIGKVSAANLVNSFGSIENIFEKLHLNDLPSLSSPDLLSLTSKEKEIYYRSIYNDEIKYKKIINQLKEANIRPIKTIHSLHAVGLEKLLLYRKLVTLDKNIDLSVFKTTPFANVDSTLLPEEFSSLIDYSLSSSNPTFSNLSDSSPFSLPTDELFSHTSHLMYQGEPRLKDVPIELVLSTISSNLLDPLRLLRSHYHKL